MTFRVPAAAHIIMALGVSSASAQSIGVFGDASCATCNLEWTEFVQSTFYVNVVTGGDVQGIVGADFLLTDDAGVLASGIVTVSPNPMTTVFLGDPRTGTSLAFSTCQTGSCINLLRVDVIPIAPVPTATVSIEAHPDTAEGCPIVELCDLTWICVAGGQAIVNDSSHPCTIAVNHSTWSEVKGLYD